MRKTAQVRSLSMLPHKFLVCDLLTLRLWPNRHRGVFHLS